MPDRLNSISEDAAKETLRIAAIPLDIRYADVRGNLELAARAVGYLPSDTDIAVFPELFTTSFVADPDTLRDVAEAPEGETMSAIRALAADSGIALAGSYLCAEDGDYINRGFFVTPAGEAVYYDKRHLFCLSPEARLYRGGRGEIPVAQYKGWNIALAICYDLRFPAWCRNRGQRYDVLLIPANWPEARRYAWSHLLIARAIENQAIVVGANRSGTDAYGTYDGMTEIYDAMGQPVGVVNPARDAETDSAVVSADLSLSRLRKIRSSLPFGNDADDFAITL